MFALGWWTRDRNYNRDVYTAAEAIADDSGGIFVPELGTVRGGKRLVDRYRTMSPAAKAEMQRRFAYYTTVMEPTFDPPSRGIVNSTIDSTEIQERIELFRQMARRSPNPKSPASSQHENKAEQ
tara:strand:+ start:18190 stop:18561 length:372 start_codon:yes stop_codon:yes gene_type:complete